jgi:thermolysin
MKLLLGSVVVLAAFIVTFDTIAAQRVAVPRSATARTQSPARTPPRDPVTRGPVTRSPSARAGRQPASSRVATFRIAARSGAELTVWNAELNQRLRSGKLRLRRVDQDPRMPARSIERLQAYHGNVPIWGAEVVRDSRGGLPVSIFGEVVGEPAIETRPQLSNSEAASRLSSLLPDAVTLTDVELTLLRLDSGDLRLAYTAVVSGGGDVLRLFIDASQGTELRRLSEIQTQAAVGTGQGVLGDNKKLSVLSQGGTFLADDQHRPPVLTTYDLGGSISRATSVVLGNATLFPSEIAQDADNNWTNPATVDAHVHAGWTYDYYFRRFQRRGLDNEDRPLTILTNAASQQSALTLSPELLNLFGINAFWCGSCGPGGNGVMFFGNGIPSNTFLTSTGQTIGNLAGALDVAAHELTHGVISSSSQLIASGESGALNEGFADIMGTSVEFFYHPAGAGPGRADYILGEDVFRAVTPAGRNGVRSMENPVAYGSPDHYSIRFTGTQDSGGIHINSTIVSHAFYLAVEGGTNRTSGLAVQGVGGANREQMERVFYRAFVFLLPSSATFATARAATIQAARDLYGANSPAERAVTQAWTAVGVL